MFSLPKRSIVLFALLVLYWLCASIFVIEARDIWLDEGFTFMFVNSEADVFRTLVLGNEMNMAPYYALVRPFALGGLDTIELRYLSLVPAFATIVALFWFCRRHFSEGLAVVAVFVLIANPLFIRYSGELRAYSLTMLLCLLGLIVLYQFLQSRKAIYLFALSGIVILSFYSGFLSLIYFGVVGAILLVDCIIRRGAQLKPLISAFVICLLALLPGLYVILTSGGENLDWIDPVSFEGMYRMLSQLLGSLHTGSAWVERLVFLGFILLCSWVLYSWLRWCIMDNHATRGPFYSDRMPLPSKAVPAVIVAGGTLAIGFGLSVLQSIMVLRYFTMVIPVLTLVVAIGLWSIPYCPARNGVVAVALAIFVYQSVFLFDDEVLQNQTDDWPAVTAGLLQGPCSEDIGLVVLSPFEQVRFNAQIPHAERRSGKLACIRNTVPDWFDAETGGLVPGVDVHKDIRSVKSVDWNSILEQYRTLWVITVNRAASDQDLSVPGIARVLNKSQDGGQYELKRELDFSNTKMLLWERNHEF